MEKRGKEMPDNKSRAMRCIIRITLAVRFYVQEPERLMKLVKSLTVRFIIHDVSIYKRI